MDAAYDAAAIHDHSKALGHAPIIDRKGGAHVLSRRRLGLAEDVADEHWLDVIDVNLNGLFWCCRSFGSRMIMIARRCGAIVNLGSMSGLIVNRPQKQSYYNASKAAVHHLTRSLATEWVPVA